MVQGGGGWWPLWCWPQADQRMSTQQSGSVQSTCSADGRLPGLRRIGTTQAERRGDQMWPLGQVVIGGGRQGRLKVCPVRP